MIKTSCAVERDRIESTLIDLCVERTYAEVTVPMLVERAGVDREAFEEHYAGLEECFCTFYLRMREEFMQEVGAAFFGESNWRDGIRASAYAMRDYLRADLKRARISFVEVLFVGERAGVIRDEAMRSLFALIDLGRNEPGVPETVTQYTAETIGSGIYHSIQVIVSNDELDEFDSRLREMMYTVVLPYLGEEAAREELLIPPPD
jgi:AcrR family transcriptional regulator